MNYAEMLVFCYSLVFIAELKSINCTGSHIIVPKPTQNLQRECTYCPWLIDRVHIILWSVINKLF